ncbi:MAG: hypothetical protein ABJA82_04575 [Myxococcales bacterium]
MRAVVAAVLAVGALVGCEGGSVFPPSDMSFEAFCPAWQAAIAAQYQRCNRVPPAALDLNACASHEAALSAGRQRFDRSAAAGCLRQWQQGTCAQFHAFGFPTCVVLFRGRVGEGGACVATDDCEYNLSCDQQAAIACPGVCRRKVAADGDCGAYPVCAIGYSCVETSDGRRCRGRAGVGEPCGPTIAGCSGPTVCASASAGESPTCRPLLYPGDGCTAGASACVSYAFCAAGACKLNPLPGDACGQIGDAGAAYVPCIKGWCDGPPTGPPGVCREQFPPGGACTDDVQCAGATAVCVQNVCEESICPA